MLRPPARLLTRPLLRLPLERSIASAYSPLALFAAGEQGVWYDYSDFSTLFQDSAGTIPVTAVEQVVGKINDKSGRGNHATQATTSLKPIVSARVNLLLATATLSTQSVTTRATNYKLSFTGAGTITASGTNVGVYTEGSNTITCTAGTLTLTVVGSVTLADLRVSSESAALPAYQAVVDASTYTTTGFPMFLACDGVDDFVVTAAINFTATDKMTVWSGLRKLSDATISLAIESSVSSSATNGTIAVMAPNSGANLTFRSKASLAGRDASYTNASVAAPISVVLTGQSSISDDSVVLRINGAVVASTVLDQGTGNYANEPVYLGRRAGASFPFTGRIYSLIIRGAASSAAEITAAETYVNGKTLAY